MAVQTTYLTENIVAIAGAVVDGQLKNERSGYATVAIPFGRFVARAAADGALKLPVATGEVTATGAGVAVRTQANVANSSDLLQYEINDSVTFLDFGVVYVLIDGTVTTGANCFVRFASGGGGSALGTFRADADTATAVALPGAYFLKGGTTGQIVPARIRMVAGV